MAMAETVSSTDFSLKSLERFNYVAICWLISILKICLSSDKQYCAYFHDSFWKQETNYFLLESNWKLIIY